MIKLLQVVLLIFLGVTPVLAQLYHNPVIPGDHSDPSVVRVGSEYWATTTSGTWEPEFPLFRSRDLIHWEILGAVFQKRPAWAERDFWAPEISTHDGRFFVYYTARKKGGPLCVAVATASNVAGPYLDHGPLVCQKLGSIDAMATTDEHGARYLVWKEDGNSKDQPTPLWAQRLSDDGLKLLGRKLELIRNDPGSWEGGVVEGAFTLRRGNWFYLFYSGNACCGRRCNYALGVARSSSLLGPYEKYAANPILAANETWQCPGHGSIVTDTEGRDFLLYHAYRKSESAFFLGREALLDEVTWGSDGWPKINDGRGPSGPRAFRSDSLFDEFEGQNLRNLWQWPQQNQPSIIVANGWLTLSATGREAKDDLATVLSQPVTSPNFTATTSIDYSVMKPSAVAGLATYQNRENVISITVGGGTVSTYVHEGKKLQTRPCETVVNSSRVYLRMTVSEGSRFRFASSLDGENWKNCGKEIQAAYLESARIALTVGGSQGVAAKFDWLRVTSQSAP
jgi:xylan 1,4-beta-xylosidase